MAQRNLNLGTPPAGTDGDTVRAAFEKVQANTTELYNTKQDGIEGLTPAGISFLQAGDAADQREILGLGNVDNTSDADKPVSAPQQQAIDGREAVLVPGANITIDRTDPAAPVISSTGGSGGTEWGAIGGDLEDQIDLQNALNSKVDTAPGMGLSEQDFTSELMMKLNEIEPMAQRNVPTNLAQGTRSATEVVVTSSTGGGATLSAASTTFAGLMSASDKSKVDAIPTSTDGLSEGSTNLYFTAARVRSTLLTGLVAGTNAVIAATDTLLQALAKLQAQVTAKLTNPMTGPGDLIVGGAGGAATRLPMGTAGQVPRVNAAGTGLEYGSVPAAASYESPGQSIVPSGQLTLTHGLGTKPRLIQLSLVCVAANAGYSPGDEVLINPQQSPASLYGVAVSWDATNVYARFTTANPVFYIGSKTSGAPTDITPASWRLVVRAAL